MYVCMYVCIFIDNVSDYKISKGNDLQKSEECDVLQ